MNTTIVIVLVLVIIVAVAAVLLMGGGGGGDTTPVKQTTTTDDQKTTDTTKPVDKKDDTKVDDTKVPDAMAGLNFNQPMECKVTDKNTGMVSVVKVEGSKMRIETNMQGMDSIVLTSDGKEYYMYSPQMGWMKMEDPGSVDDYEDMEAVYMEPPAGITYECKNLADISDSEFQLPAGAEVVDLEDMMAGLEDMDLSAYM